jgi:hypothetical protein
MPMLESVNANVIAFGVGGRTRAALFTAPPAIGRAERAIAVERSAGDSFRGQAGDTGDSAQKPSALGFSAARHKGNGSPNSGLSCTRSALNRLCALLSLAGSGTYEPHQGILNPLRTIPGIWRGCAASSTHSSPDVFTANRPSVRRRITSPSQRASCVSPFAMAAASLSASSPSRNPPCVRSWRSPMATAPRSPAS